MSLSNITLTCNNKRVTIATTKISEDLANALTSIIATPTTSITNAKTTRVTNLLKITQRFIIDGYITTGLGTNISAPVERSNSKDVKDDLKEMFNRRALTVLTYDGSSYNITMEKLRIDEEAREGDEVVEGVVRYVVSITCIVGSLTI